MTRAELFKSAGPGIKVAWDGEKFTAEYMLCVGYSDSADDAVVKAIVAAVKNDYPDRAISWSGLWRIARFW